MPHSFVQRSLRFLAFGAGFALLTACGTPSQPTQEINDPIEGFNRGVHAFNKGLDKAVVSDASRIYVTVTPDPVLQGITNFFNNLGEPLNVINNALQGDIDGVTYSTLRFATNTTFGLAGLYDAASALGVPEDRTDFGETLYTWGVGEGPFLSVPFFGPQTTRRMVGRGVDIVIDPLGTVVGFFDGATVQATLFVLDALKTRDDNRTAIDQVFYESADSYAQTRIVYLQNRRFTLGRDENGLYLDPYEDPYGEAPAGGDQYLDPYEDPYEQ